MFNVKGLFSNEEVDAEIERSERTETTSYRGELAAIRWRLPTPDELLAFGATTLQSA